MAGETIKIEGLKELQDRLNALAKKESRKIARRGISRMAQVIQKEMKARAPVKTGYLRKSIGYKIRQRMGQFYGTVGPQRTVVKSNNLASYGDESKRVKKYTWAYYAQFLEFGSAAHLIPNPKRKQKTKIVIGKRVFSSADHPGIAPRPFLRPAFDAAKRRAVDESGKLMWQLIEKAAAKK